MKVLLATDGSTNAVVAAKFLSQLAGKEKFDVTVFSVSFAPGYPHSSGVEPWYPEWSKRETERVAAFQEPIRAMLADVCETVSIGMSLGDPVPGILDEAERIGADLIVVGAKGHTTLHRLLLGSTSDSVATHATCSVLVVRANAKEDAPVMGVPPKLLIAYDGSDGSREAVSEQLSLNWDSKTEVSLISVAAQPYAYFDESFSAITAQLEIEVAEKIRLEGERMSGEIAQTLPNVSLQVPRVHHIGDAIATAAETNHDDLVVVGDAGHSLIGEMLLGSTTKYVLRHAPCSVWISRHHRRDE
ncbi:universal stress protein [Rubripirellula reticaptiva]|uniref:Universal stress protein n=1 Tax=Rubripirellula reticaptiva TaxID=2528013 RepID=A0A5C6F5A0_9BACT|nr:universal stress protein [Rubripirellula reticaptiva]TWU55256.1 Universal stress protein [Rubripirellula reticaptiva]